MPSIQIFGNALGVLALATDQRSDAQCSIFVSMRSVPNPSACAAGALLALAVCSASYGADPRRARPACAPIAVSVSGERSAQTGISE